MCKVWGVKGYADGQALASRKERAAMHDENVHQRCQWCGICLKCQEPLARESKCGNPRNECKRWARVKVLRNLNPPDTNA